MRKFFSLLFTLILSGNITFSAIDSATGEEIKGYMGTLPDVTQRFEPFRTKVSKPKYEDVSGFNIPRGFKPAPKDNPGYLDLMIRKESVSEYKLDVQELIRIVELVINSIEKDEDVQKFSAKVNSLNNNTDYFKNKYRDKPESYYPSYDNIIDVSIQAKMLLALKSESRLYSPYKAYGGEGQMYSPQNISRQTIYLLQALEKVLIVLKEAN